MTVIPGAGGYREKQGFETRVWQSIRDRRIIEVGAIVKVMDPERSREFLHIGTVNQVHEGIEVFLPTVRTVLGREGVLSTFSQDSLLRLIDATPQGAD